MIRYVERYINHVKRQSHAIKEVHAVLFATVGTLLFIFLYLYIGSVSSTEDSKGVSVSSTEFESPLALFMRQIEEAFSQIGKGGTIKVSNEGDVSTGKSTDFK